MELISKFIRKKLEINERLIINKNTKIKNHFVNAILRFICSEPKDAEDKEVKLIEEWVNEENVEHLIILSTNDVLEKYGLIDPDHSEEDLRKDFESDNVEIILEQRFYDGYSKDIGEEIYKDKYGFTSYYKNNKNYTLTYKVKYTGNIFFISKK